MCDVKEKWCVTGEEFIYNLHGLMKKLGHRMREREKERDREGYKEKEKEGKKSEMRDG